VKVLPNSSFSNLVDLKSCIKEFGLTDYTEEGFAKFCENARYSWRVGPSIIKANGETRQTYAASGDHLTCNLNIKHTLKTSVTYPNYLTGGLPKRNSLSNARQHLGAKSLIKLDIKNFYENIHYESVYDVFSNLFCLPTDIARIIALLSCQGNSLAQGGSQSSYIANMVLWKCEPSVVSRLSKQGFVYTRYVDDITVSAKETIDVSSANKVIQCVSEMTRSISCELNSKKTFFTNKPDELTITGIRLSNGTRIPRKYRRNVRAGIYNLLNASKQHVPEGYLIKTYQKLLGQISHISQCHPREARRLQEELLPLAELF